MLSSPDDWIYLAEGGRHVIFRNRDERIAIKGTECDALADTSFDYFYGRVLRIQKSTLARAAKAVATNHQYHDDDASSQRPTHHFDLKQATNSMTSSERFRRLVVGPILGSCYLDTYHTLVLPAQFCFHLYRSAMASGAIPSSRLSSWETQDHDNAKVAHSKHIVATLLPNHTVMKLHPLSISTRNIKNPTILSVEIKPKAGYLTESPLVLPEHRCKYYHTRYFLQQTLMEKGIVKKGWCKQQEKHNSLDDGYTAKDHIFIRSNYTPLDLFSANFMRMKEALRELSKNMQNNFRVWCNGIKVFGEYEYLPSTKYNEILHGLLGRRPSTLLFSEERSTLLDVVVHVVAKILYREKLLDNLLCLQLLDVIDGDGAVLIYNRLVSLCNGSHSEAEMAVEQFFIPSNGFPLSCGLSRGDSIRHNLVACSPYQPPEDSSFDALMNEMQRFRTYLQHQRQAGLAANESMANKFHSACVHQVKHLSKESCIYLLSNWLLSLTMCDVSLFVTFHFCEDGDSNDLGEDVLKEHNQTEEKGGLFVCRLESVISTSPNVMVQYEVKVVDCDPKPAIKLRGREDIEKYFQFCSQ